MEVTVQSRVVIGSRDPPAPMYCEHSTQLCHQGIIKGKPKKSKECPPIKNSIPYCSYN